MKGYTANIEKLTLENNNFRHVLYTAPHMQLVVMSLKAGEDIGEEVHQLDQFIRVEQGRANAILDAETYELKDGSVVVIPAGTRHNIINTGESDLKLYTLYAPPNHPDGTVHQTKAQAEGEEHHE